MRHVDWEEYMGSLKQNSPENQVCFRLKTITLSESQISTLLLELWTKTGHGFSRDLKFHWWLNKDFNCDTWPVLEGVSHRNGDLFLSKTGVYFKRLGKWGCFHHTGITCLHTVVHPYTQSEAGIAVWLLYDSWKFGWDAEGLQQIYNVASDHLVVQQPLITYKTENTEYNMAHKNDKVILRILQWNLS